MANILVCDDDKEIVEAISIYLSQEGYQIFKAYNGREAIEVLQKEDIQLLLIDIMMPEMDGIHAMIKIRSFSAIPILVLSAKSEDVDKILGLNVGADDYITKPFSTEELLARIRSISRRNQHMVVENALTFSDITLNLSTYEMFCGEKSIKLGLKEFYMMELLLRNGSIVLSKETLIEKIWGYESDVEYNNVEVYISFLRKKLTHIESTVSIKTVRGVGYCLESKQY